MPALEPPDPTPTEYVYVEELPVPIRTPAPAYPELARQAGVEGTVQLRALIGLDGRVRDVIVDRSIALLDEAAVQAVRGWVFSPALANGRPVKVWVGVPVHFVLH
jgi:protein TonB